MCATGGAFGSHLANLYFPCASFPPALSCFPLNTSERKGELSESLALVLVPYLTLALYVHVYLKNSFSLAKFLRLTVIQCRLLGN